MTSAALINEQNVDAEAVAQPSFARYIPLCVWLIALMTISWIPLKVISYGYLPPDDALRHTGKAITGRPWNEILVLRDDAQMDHNPGWHWLLRRIHTATGADADALVSISLVGLFLLALGGPIVGFKRPEAWIAALLISIIAFPLPIYRVLLGRPFAITVAVVLYVLLLWRQPDEKRPSALLLLGTTALLALSAWLHGCWYLFSLVPAAFCLAGQWRSALWLGGCWACGSLLGATATGHPVEFLVNALRIVMNSFKEAPLQRMLVTEYQPSGGNFTAILVAAILLTWRYLNGAWTWRSIQNPIFMLAVLGWVLGLKVGRFDTDWAAPALLLWVALEVQEPMARYLSADGLRRLAVSAGLAVALLLAATTDVDSRWTRSLDVEFLSQSDPEMAPWLPEPGGILYSSDMTIFYQTFFKNPNAQWRYILGFESTFMPLEDLRILRNIQRNYGAYKAYQPWVNKMRPQDRLVIRAGSSASPDMKELEWHYTARNLWVGRKPHKEAGASTATTFKANPGESLAAATEPAN
jgi:hypothetical protein